jgi:tRNA pseudouridine38-40 synthase
VVGAGERSPEWIAELLAARDRTVAAKTAPPDGLYLAGVDYAADWQLPATACDPPMLAGSIP